MPKTPATAVWPTSAAQIVARNKPADVAARMIGRAAPTAPAGTTPTSARPSTTDPTMKLGSPSMAGSPACMPTAAASAAATSECAPGWAESPAVASSAVMGCPSHRECSPSPATGAGHDPSLPRRPPAAVLSLSRYAASASLVGVGSARAVGRACCCRACYRPGVLLPGVLSAGRAVAGRAIGRTCCYQACYWPGVLLAGRAVSRRAGVAGRVALQAAEHVFEVRDVFVADAAPEPLIERIGRAAQLAENDLALLGQLYPVDAAVLRITPAGDQALVIHRVQVVGERRFRDPHRTGQFPLVAQLLALERDEHEPDRKRSPCFGERLIERAAHRPGGAGQPEADGHVCGARHGPTIATADITFDVERFDIHV